MFTSKYKLDGIDNILNDIGYLDEMKGAGEDQEDKYTKKSGKKSKDFDGDGDVEDETDEYAGVKDKAIKKATGKKSDCEDTKKESINISTVLDELSDEDIIFLSDDLIEEVVEEFFYETLSEGFEVDELETLLTEQLTFELRYLEEAKITVGHDSDEVEQPESSRTSKLAKIGSAIKKVASGAKKVAKKIGGAAGEVAGATVAGFRKASASSEQDDDDDDSSSTGPQQSGTSATPKKVTQTGTQRPGILGRVGAALKSGLKKVVYGAGKVAGKVVKTAKAGYQDGASNSTPTAKPVAAKPVAAKPVAKKSKGKLANLIAQVQKETTQSSNETTIMETKDLRNLQEAYLDVYEQDEILDEAEVMKHQKERSAIERRKKMKGYEPPTKGVHGEIERRQAQKPPSKLRSGSLPESYDLYDIILSHLIGEGYAETEDAAESIMVNMSEEWREDIMEISQKTATRAYASSATGEFEGQDDASDVKRTDNLGKHIERKFGKKALEDANRHADSTTFGRKDPRTGKRQPKPESRFQNANKYRTTKDGKMHGQDQNKLKAKLERRRGEN